jgi:hypothetical protein
MGKVAVEHIFTGTTTGITTYDANLTTISSLYKQFTGATAQDNYISLLPSSMVNIADVANATYSYPYVHQWSSNIFWVFMATTVAAAATRTFGLFEYDSSANTTTWKGFITLQGTQLAGNKTVRGLRAYVYETTGGTVSATASSTITGSGTAFQTSRISVGARIGFGSTDPTQISTWYEITAIASDTSLTIGNTVTVSAGSSYVIEEIRVYFLQTNATLQNSGLYIIKGLNFSTFALGGTSITESTTTDNIRASYLLKDFAPSTVTISNASPGVVTLASHGLRLNDAVHFTTTGALPSPLAVATVYYVTSTSLAANTFTVSATINGAAINTTTAGSGTHTLHSAMSVLGGGLAIDEPISATEQYIYLLNSEVTNTNIRLVKYNIRASLTPNSANGATGALSLRTTPLAVTGTISLLNNGRMITVQHGSASGIKSIYFATTTRIYRCTESAILDNSTTFLSDQMIEIPPGGIGNAAYTLTSTMSSVDYSSTIDRLLIATTSGRLGVYAAQYNTSGSQQFDKIFGANMNRYKLGITPVGTVDGLFPQATLTIWSEGGLFFSAPISTTTGLNWLLIYPGGGDGYFASYSNQRVITPKMATPNASKLYRAYVENADYLGTYQLGFPPEPFRVYFRTSGIDDNSGSWTEVPESGDLSSFAASTYIQFMLELDSLGEVCAPTKVYAVTCIYEDATTDVHYQPSIKYSDYVNKRFAWWFALAWGSTVPTLRVLLYDANTNNLLVDDNPASPTGTFEKSTDDGSTWGAYNTTDRANATTYIRYTPASLGDNIKVKFILTQY